MGMMTRTRSRDRIHLGEHVGINGVCGSKTAQYAFLFNTLVYLWEGGFSFYITALRGLFILRYPSACMGMLWRVLAFSYSFRVDFMGDGKHRLRTPSIDMYHA